MFYLNRGGAPEGPFDEARIVQMIRTGELTQGGVCPVGQNQWWPLQQIPAFAQALAQRAAAPAPAPAAGYGPPQAGGYGPPPQAPQYGAAPQQYGGAPGPTAPGPTAPGYGPAPAAPGYGPGPTAPGYGPAPGQAGAGYAAAAVPGGAHRAVPEQRKKGGRGLLIAVLAGVLVLFLISSAIGAYLLFFSTGGAPQMSATMPRDTEMLMEITSIPKLVLDFRDVEYLDTSLRDDKKVFDDTADSVAKAFDISQSDARAFLVSAKTIGIGARKLSAAGGQPEAAFALGFGSADPVEALLKSTRFVASGALGQTGKRYQLTKKVLQSSVGQDLLLKGLADAELGSGKEVLVWFPTKKLLAVGTESFVVDLAKVIEEGAAAVETNPSFVTASKDFDSSAELRGFLDPSVVANIDDPKVKEFIDGYLKPAAPLTGALRVKSAGFVTSLTGHFIGSKLPKSAAYVAPRKLELPNRLPVETFAYMAVQTESKLSGADMQKQMFDQLQAIEPRGKAQMEEGLGQMERALGVSLSKLLDGLGNEAVLAVATPADFVFDPGLLEQGPQAASKLSVTWVQELKDDAEMKRLSAQLKQKILPTIREAALTEDGPGFSLTPRGTPAPLSLRVKFFDKYLFITAGGNQLCDRAEGAFSKGDRTLKDDAAHQSALAALPDKHHFRFWLDTGRVLDTLFKNPALRASATENGMQLEKFRLTGPQRVTSAFSIDSKVENEVWTYHVDALNLQALAPLGLGASSLAGGGRRSGLPPL